MTRAVSPEVSTSAAAPVVPAEWPPLRVLRPATAQRIFRVCMEAFARPGTITRIPRDGLPEAVPAVVAPLLALTDLMTPVAAVDVPGQNAAAEAVQTVAGLTGATIATPGNARFALALGESERMALLSVGSHWSPEYGVMLCQRVDAVRQVTTSDSPAPWRLRGPGVPGTADVVVSGLTVRFLELRAQLTSDFPAGVDILLVSDDGVAVGLPRTTRIEVA